MRILNEPAIDRFIRKHADARRWLAEWLTVTRAAEWQTIQDVKRSYSTADGGVRVPSGARVTVFDVGGNKHRMVTAIFYQASTITILELMTHAEYSRQQWKRRY